MTEADYARKGKACAHKIDWLSSSGLQCSAGPRLSMPRRIDPNEDRESGGSRRERPSWRRRATASYARAGTRTRTGLPPRDF